jgi:hypothetical protein
MFTNFVSIYSPIYPMLLKPNGGCGIRRIASPLFFEDAKGFAGKVWTLYVLRIENQTKFVTRKT